jgi:hypothetical protein
MTPLQQLANLQLGNADANRLTQLIACLKRVNEPTLEQIFHELFPLLDENKAKAAFRQGCDLNLKQPIEKKRQTNLFFAKTESIV